MIYNGESIHVRQSEQTWQNQNDYAKQGKMINQYNQHVNVLNKHDNEAQKKSKSSIKIINLIISMSNISYKYINEALGNWLY